MSAVAAPARRDLRRVLVANRGAVAARVIRALRGLGIESVAVHSDADRDLPYLRDADVAIPIGPAVARESYLDAAKILDAARRTGAQVVHPGYGFLPANAAIERLRGALSRTRIAGVRTNVPFLLAVLRHADFNELRIDTGLAQRVLDASRTQQGNRT